MNYAFKLIAAFLILTVRFLTGSHGLIVPEHELIRKKSVSELSLPSKKDPYYKVRDFFFWWHSLPTVGIKAHPLFSPVCYPFIPHYFSLYELAPHQGRSSIVSLIDNGVASASLYTHDTHQPLLNVHPYIAQVKNGGSYTDLVDKPSWYTYKELVYFFTDQRFYDDFITLFKTYNPSIHDRTYLTKYLIRYGKTDLRITDSQLSARGLSALQKLIDCWQSTTIVVDETTHHTLPLHLLAVPDYIITYRPSYHYADQQWLYANHGTFCAGLIQGMHDNKLIGIAPQATLIGIKATHSLCHAYQDPCALIHALDDIITSSISVVSLSYSMQTSAGYAKELEQYLKVIPFSCIALGNKKGVENYFSHSSSITALVGSFGISDYSSYPISSFNNTFANTAWTVVMPGEKMLSCCYNPYMNDQKTLFVFMQGTSCATPLLSGFLALLIGECYPILSYEQIKLLLRYATVYLHTTESWKQAGAGTIDMRMALFMGHVLKEFAVVDKSFGKNYIKYVQTVRTYLLKEINTYGKQSKIPILFEEGMIDFLKKAYDKNITIQPTHKDLADYVKTIALDIYTNLLE